MKAVVFDVETTGLDALQDTIIQFSACDLTGKELINTYIRPKEKYFEDGLLQRWLSAAEINGIYPSGEEMATAPSFADVKEDIQRLFDRADVLIAYNGQYDLKFLGAAGITFNSHIPFYDVMLAYAEYNGEWNEGKGGYKWKKLVECAAHFGFEFEAHDSLEDVKATAFCCNKLWDKNVHLENGKIPTLVKEFCPSVYFTKSSHRKIIDCSR